MKDGISLTAWEQWMGNTYSSRPLQTLVLSTLIIKVRSPLYCWPQQITASWWLMWGAMAATVMEASFANSLLGKALRDGTLNVPPPSELQVLLSWEKLTMSLWRMKLFRWNHISSGHTLDTASPPTREFSIIICLGHGTSLKMYLASSVNASGFSKEFYRFNQVLLTKLSKLLVHRAIICAQTEMTRIMPQRMTMIVSKHYKALNIVGASGHLWRHKMSENCTNSTSTHQQEKLLGSMTM